jgi:serine/threonine protein phosphatase PrpC
MEEPECKRRDLTRGEAGVEFGGSEREWPKCSFFGIYDGHGGHKCAEFLHKNLHNIIIQQPCFPSNPSEALKRGFHAAESQFIESHALSPDQSLLDKSGSCALVTLIVN